MEWPIRFACLFDAPKLGVPQLLRTQVVRIQFQVSWVSVELKDLLIGTIRQPITLNSAVGAESSSSSLLALIRLELLKSMNMVHPLSNAL